MTGTATTPTTATARWRDWVFRHDDSWIFVIGYVGLAVILSLWISLFWLVMVVAVHGLLERHVLIRRGVTRGRTGMILWHLKLDIALVLFALALGVYLDTLFGLVGLGAAANAGARMLSWQQVIRGVLLTLDDAAQVARAVAAGRKRQPAATNSEPDEQSDTTSMGGDTPAPQAPTPLAPWRDRWSGGDRLALAVGALSLLALLTSPLLTGLSPAEALTIVAADLHPWP